MNTQRRNFGRDVRTTRLSLTTTALVAALAGACGPASVDDGGGGDGGAGAGGNAGTGGNAGGAGAAGAAGGAGTGGGAGGGAGTFQSKSGTTALAYDQSWLAVANRDVGSVTVFVLNGTFDLSTAGKFTISLGNKSSEVSSLTAGHDNTYFLATLQYDQKLCKVIVANGPTQTPTCVATGSEPTGVAVNEDGSRVFVANMVDGTVRVYNASLGSVATLDFSDANGESQRHPYALLYLKLAGAAGNLYVTDFFAEKISGAQEGSDTSRQGVVVRIPGNATSLANAQNIILPPMPDTGFRIPDDNAACLADNTAAGCTADPIPSGAFPNQLASISFHEGRIHVLSTCASPRGNFRFNMNLHSCLHVIDAASNAEVPAMRMNIQARIAQQASGSDRFFCTIPSDMACVPDTGFCYVSCSASDIVMRLDFTGATSEADVEAGLSTVKNLPTGKFPTGITIVSDVGVKLAYVNNENSRNVTTIDLTQQSSLGQESSASLPTPGSLEDKLLKGKDFFFTSRGRWSAGRWSSCAGCHPRGLTDNVTWHFPTGPRQTISMDGSFSKQNVTADSFGNKHGFINVVTALDNGEDFPSRIFNWTSVRDEIADFELNVRAVSGGLGAIVDANNTAVDIAGGDAAQDALIPGGIGDNSNNNGSTEALVAALGTVTDWEEITEWARTIRAPRAKSNVPGNVAAGATLYTAEYSCDSCHAGGAWTVSQRYYTPTLNNNAPAALSQTLKNGGVFVDDFAAGKNGFMTAITPLIDEKAGVCVTDADCNNITDACNTATGKCRVPALGFEFYASAKRGIDEHACVLRDVGTFEAPDSAQGGLELRNNMAAIAQGEAGFNPPSLFNLSMGAPYLHNGRYETLAEFLTETNGTRHINLANAVASINATQLRDLVAYLLSIDGSTPTINPSAANIICEPQ